MGGGQNKALILLAGRPLLSYSLSRLAPQAGPLAISVHEASTEIAAFGFECLPDMTLGQMGPLAGVLAGMVWAVAQGARHIVTVPVDGPFLPLDLVARLGVRPQPALAMAGGRQHPTYGIWPVDLAPGLAEFLASGAVPRVRDFAALAAARWVEFPDPEAFDNLNTPEDLTRAEARL
jgi:molybdopterin-guanine dinucleotide biosynthesis protein A